MKFLVLVLLLLSIRAETAWAQTASVNSDIATTMSHLLAALPEKVELYWIDPEVLLGSMPTTATVESGWSAKVVLRYGGAVEFCRKLSQFAPVARHPEKEPKAVWLGCTVSLNTGVRISFHFHFRTNSGYFEGVPVCFSEELLKWLRRIPQTLHVYGDSEEQVQED